MSINRVILVGNVGQDPEIRTMSNGRKVASLSVATENAWKDKATGERRKSTDWHRVVVFAPGLVTLIERYVKKGSKISLEGKLKTRDWTDSNGQKRYVTEVVLEPYNSSLKLEGGRQTQGDSSRQYQPVPAQPNRQREPAYAGGYDNDFYSSDADDDVPF